MGITRVTRTTSTSRFDLVEGAYLTGPTTTGYLPGTLNGIINGTSGTYTPAAGEVITNKEIRARLSIQWPDIFIDNCWINALNHTPTGPTQANVTFLVNANNANAKNLIVQNSTIAPSNPSAFWGAGIRGHDFISRFNDISRCVDGIEVANSNYAEIGADGSYASGGPTIAAASNGAVVPGATTITLSSTAQLPPVGSIRINGSVSATSGVHVQFTGISGNTITGCTLLSPSGVTLATGMSVEVVTYPSGVISDRDWIHDMAFWTASTGGIVHSSDVVTHNDGIQLFGGTGTQVLGTFVDARGWAMQYGHYMLVDVNAEVRQFVAAGGAPDGIGPLQPIPDRNAPAGTNGGAVAGGTTTTNYGATSTTANGRWYWGDLSCMLANDDVGVPRDTLVRNCTFYGGVQALNFGGVRKIVPSGGVDLGLNVGTFTKNKFDHTQGAYAGVTGPNDTVTISVGQTSTEHAGRVTSNAGTGNANTYVDNGFEINFRGD